MRKFISIFLVFLFMFSLPVYASDSFVLPYLRNVLIQSGKIISSSSANNKFFYIEMSDLTNYSFLLKYGNDSHSISNVTFNNYFYCSNEKPSVGSSIYSNSPLSDYLVVSGNGTIDITDRLRSMYNSNYTYLIFSGKASNSTDIGYVSITAVPDVSPTPSPTVVPTVAPTASPTSSPSSGIYAGSDTFIWGTDSVWPFASYRYSASVWEHYFDDRSSGTGIVGTYVVYPVKIPFWVETDSSGSYIYDLNFNIQSMSFDVAAPGSVTPYINKSSPYISCADSSIAWTASFLQGNSLSFNIYNLPVNNKVSPTFYLCFDVMVSFNANYEYSNSFDSCLVNCNNLSFSVRRQTTISENSSGILGDINDNIIKGNEQEKNFHDEEISETERAIDQMNEGVSTVTDTLSKWEIITLPIKVTTDVIDAITSDEGSTGLTFPSFELMGQQLWPSYTFDLSVIEEKFPVLITALHTISGILIVVWFIDYLWLKSKLIWPDHDPDPAGYGHIWSRRT